MAEGMACYYHNSQPAVAQCNGCKKSMCKDCYDITGAWCRDCVKEMSDTTIGNFEALASRLNKQKIIMLVLSAIGAVFGLLGGLDSMMGTHAATGNTAEMVGQKIAAVWAGTGIGAAVAFILIYLIHIFDIFKNAMEEEGFFGAIKTVVLGGLIISVLLSLLGIIIGPIFTFVIALRRSLWVKKCKRIIAEEEETLVTLENVLAGKQANTGVSAKVRQIVDNFELARNGVSLDILKKILI